MNGERTHRIYTPAISLCLPRGPSPLPGEFLGSWVARAAVMNGYEPRYLAAWLRTGKHTHQWFLFPIHQVLTRLAKASGVDDRELELMAFSQDLELCEYPFVHQKDAGNWIIPVPNHESARPSLTQLCPDCLSTDRIPYLRKDWRYAFITHCPLHRTRMLSQCPDCGRAINPFEEVHQDLIRYQASLFLRCPCCGYHLGGFTQTYVQTESPSVMGSIHLSQVILRGQREGWVTFSDRVQIPTSLFLLGLRIILRLLGSRFGLEFRMWLEHHAHLEPVPAGTGIDPYFMRFEDLPSSRRVRLLALLDWLLEDWPTRWLEGVQATRLWGSFVLEQRRRKLPFWLASVCSDPLLRLNLPLARWSSPVHQYEGGKSIAKPRIGLGSDSYDRLGFVDEHREWWSDLPQMALAMRDLGMYMPEKSLLHIQKMCRKHLMVIQDHKRAGSPPTRKGALYGHLQRRVMHRRFLKALKVVLRKLLQLDA